MIFCFSGTGNSRYVAERIAEALRTPVIDLNARIRAGDELWTNGFPTPSWSAQSASGL